MKRRLRCGNNTTSPKGACPAERTLEAAGVYEMRVVVAGRVHRDCSDGLCTARAGKCAAV